MKGIAIHYTSETFNWPDLISQLTHIDNTFCDLQLKKFKVCFITAGPLMLLLPETNKKDLPDTIEQAEELWERSSPDTVQPMSIQMVVPQ